MMTLKLWPKRQWYLNHPGWRMVLLYHIWISGNFGHRKPRRTLWSFDKLSHGTFLLDDVSMILRHVQTLKGSWNSSHRYYSPNRHHPPHRSFSWPSKSVMHTGCSPRSFFHRFTHSEGQASERSDKELISRFDDLIYIMDISLVV